MTDIIRTSKDGCFQVRSNAWGSYLSRVADPEATAELEPGALDRFQLHTGIPRIPATLWSRWVQLCFHFAHLKQGDLEVSCRLLRHEDDRSRWRILVPRQEVSGASVRIDSFDDAIDIATGELIETYPPAGWVPAGSSHSHNTMPLARFSATDDDSELSCPGLHIVLSHINLARRTYVPTASITANHRRFYLEDAAAVIDLTPTGDSFHPAVLEVIQPERRWSPWSAGPWGSSISQPDGLSDLEGNGSDRRRKHRKPRGQSAAARPSPTDVPVAPQPQTQEDLDWALQGVWEAVHHALECGAHHGFPREQLLAELLDAIRFSSDQCPSTNDDSLTWPPDDDPDLSHLRTSGADSPSASWLPAGDW